LIVKILCISLKNLEATVQISSQSVKICSSYAASQFEEHGFEKTRLKI